MFLEGVICVEVDFVSFLEILGDWIGGLGDSGGGLRGMLCGGVIWVKDFEGVLLVMGCLMMGC